MWIAFTLREWDLGPNCGLMGRDWDVFAFVVDFSRVCGFPWPGLQNSDRSVRFSRLMRLLDRCAALSNKWNVENEELMYEINYIAILTCLGRIHI